MKKFIKRLSVFLFVFFIFIELTSRLFIDPEYFNRLNTYNLSPNAKFSFTKIKNTKHVDYLFIGSSRVPATINPKIFMKMDKGKIAIVAGRGHMTAGIHYQAIKNRISEFPDYLKNANVFIEYPGSRIYESPFNSEQFLVYEPATSMDKPMPHLLLPHLKLKSLFDFLTISHNSIQVKVDMILLYFSSSYRTSFFIKEKFNKLDFPILNHSLDLLASEGGIRNDNIEVAKQKAIEAVKINKEKSAQNSQLTINSLNNSALAYLYNIINKNGGKLFLYKMPLHSIQKGVYDTEKEKENKKIFEQWLESKGIEILYTDKFKYQDSDFPDTWHLSKDRRDEFSLLLYDSFKNNIVAKRQQVK